MKPAFLVAAALHFLGTPIHVSGAGQDAASLNWYRCNTHTHTSAPPRSDASGTPEFVSEWYRSHGYHCLVITDHEYLTDVAPLNRKYASDGNFLVLQGQEITQSFADISHPTGVRHFHVNGINIDKAIMPVGYPQPAHGGSPLQTYERNIAAIHAAGGIAQLNHPNLLWSVRLEDLLPITQPFMLEVWNAFPTSNNLGGVDDAGNIGMSTEVLWDALLSNGRTVWGVASDDTHESQKLDDRESPTPGKGWIVLQAASLTVPAVTEAMRKGRFYASTGISLESYSFDAAGISIRIAPAREWSPALSPSARYVTRFVGAKGQVLLEATGMSPQYRFKGDEQYVRASIVDSDGRRAWTQPVFRDGRRQVAAVQAANSEVPPAPLRLHPDNPRYLLFRGKPTVLVGSSEHYGAVMNRDFNFVRYLDTLQVNGLNVTRVFSGQYRERAGKFGVLPDFNGGSKDFEIVENTLAPNANAYIAPWTRSPEPGALDGRNKFDLTRWNDEYFQRLQDFVQQASRRGIVVEVSLFSPYYVNAVGSHFWEISPWNVHNNINGIGDIEGGDTLSLKDEKLLAVQEAMVRRILTELRRFDNVYYEICNEPYLTDVPMSWQAHMAKVIAQTESSLGTQHLIAQEFGDISDLANIKDPTWRSGMQNHGIEARLPESSLLTFHTAHPRVVTNNYAVDKPIGQNESVFTLGDAANRISAWRILLAGGAFHHGTDYSFTRGHEDGSFVVPAGGAGGGSPALRRQLGILRAFMDGLNFIRMKPAPTAIKSAVPQGALALVLAEPARTYAIHISHDGPGPQQLSLRLDIPKGSYTARWFNTKTSGIEREQPFPGGPRAPALASPQYSEDIALIVTRNN